MMPIDSLIDDSIQCNSNFHFIQTTKATTTSQDKQTHSQFALYTKEETRPTDYRKNRFERIRQRTTRQGKTRQASSEHLSVSMMTKEVTCANMFWVRQAAKAAAEKPRRIGSQVEW
mmetsp:Transcript_15144/g.16363  ORF Transcript_15144/g.16363 Transcript_15144/m.16363 type:complete len:116 (+) Transcript_15144:252-599(+)